MNRWLKVIKKNKNVFILCIVVVALIIVLYFLNLGQDEGAKNVMKTEAEIKLVNVLEGVDGVGQVDVFIYENDKKIEGIIIVCQGANDVMVRNNVLNLVSTAFNVDKNIIAIYLMKI